MRKEVQGPIEQQTTAVRFHASGVVKEINSKKFFVICEESDPQNVSGSFPPPQ